MAARYGHVEVVHCLLEAGADKNTGNMAGNMPLHHAALLGHVEVARCLLEAGADKDLLQNLFQQTLGPREETKRGHPTKRCTIQFFDG